MIPASVSVGIPTFARATMLLKSLEHINLCDPPPAEIIVHVDQSNGQLEREIATRFPLVRTIASTRRVGPGGGRHRCIQAASQPLFASFDDDSWPIDRDFFGQVESLFNRHPRAAVLTASIYNRHDTPPERSFELAVVPNYNGGGHAIRRDAYHQITGYIDRPCAYGIEEVDVAMQLHAIDWTILKCESLRVFHDAIPTHHKRPDVVAGTIQNVALRVFLRYPVCLWPRGILQIGNMVLNMIKRRRFSGLAQGIVGIPAVLFQHGVDRRQLPADKIRSYLKSGSQLPTLGPRR